MASRFISLFSRRSSSSGEGEKDARSRDYRNLRDRTQPGGSSSEVFGQDAAKPVNARGTYSKAFAQTMGPYGDDIPLNQISVRRDLHIDAV